MNAPTPEKLSVEIVRPHELTLLENELADRRPKSTGEGAEALWEKYHASLCRTAKRFVKIGDDPEAAIDLYYSGDWSHELSDGFGIRGPEALSAEMFRAMRQVVAAHHPDAMVSLQGEWSSPIFGLDVLITASGIYLAWHDHTPDQCKNELNELGIELEAPKKNWWQFWK
jgi:hypothetical protein